jgi:hypothetical protein
MSDIRVMPERKVKARKPHRCEFCCRTIQPGEVHRLFKGFDPDRSRDGGRTWGVWVTARQHQTCNTTIAESPDHG